VPCAFRLAQIQQLKHSISKGDKKKKKGVMSQIAVLEAELESRQQQELLSSDGQDASTTVSS